jgi:RHS repeat-associated protein
MNRSPSRPLLHPDAGRFLSPWPEVNQNLLIPWDSVVFLAYSREAISERRTVNIWTAAWATRATSSFANENLFAGYRQDSETNLSLARHRYYHTTLGRWVQRDPIAYAGGPSLYQYSASNPIRFVDSLGLYEPITDASGVEVARILPGGRVLILRPPSAPTNPQPPEQAPQTPPKPAGKDVDLDPWNKASRIKGNI